VAPPLPAAMLVVACGVAKPEGLGAVVLGLLWAMGVDALPQPQLFQLIHDGDDQPLPERQPLAAPTDKLIHKAPTIVQRESESGMARHP
jgi:hypothetical protein